MQLIIPYDHPPTTAEMSNPSDMNGVLHGLHIVDGSRKSPFTILSPFYLISRPTQIADLALEVIS